MEQLTWTDAVSPRKRKAGRPKLPHGAAKSKVVPVRFTEAEAKRLSKTAKARNQTVTEWVRSTLMAALGMRDERPDN